jgi:hypothetical protein
MDKKWVITLMILCFLLGVILTGSLLPDSKELLEGQRTEYEQKIKNSKRVIDSLEVSIDSTKNSIVTAQEQINNLSRKVTVLKIKLKEEQKKVTNLSVKQKEEWLINRYVSIPNNSDSTVTIPDTTATFVINDLLTLDERNAEIVLKDSIILKHEEKDSIQSELISLQEYKSIEQDTIISNQSRIISDLDEDKKELKKELSRERFNKVKLGALAVGEAILIIALIL